MPVNFACGGCGFQTKVKDELAGKKIKCPKCGTAGVIPTVAAKPQDASSDDLSTLNLDKYQDVQPEEGEELNPVKAPVKKVKAKKKSKNAPLDGAVKGAAMGFSLLSVGVIALLVMFVLPQVMEVLNSSGETPPAANGKADGAAAEKK